MDEDAGIRGRLVELVGTTPVAEFARKCGIAPSSMAQYLTKSTPGASAIAKISRATGVRPDWLILGEGPKYAGDEIANEKVPLDADLLGRVVDRIAKVYRELGVSLPDVDLGRLAAEKYAEIQDLAADRDEWPPALDLMAVRLRKALLQAADAPGSTKSRA